MLTGLVPSNSPLQASFGRHGPTSWNQASVPARYIPPLGRAASRSDQINSRQEHEAKALVHISPYNAVTRRTAAWHGMAAEIIQATSHTKTEYSFRAPVHLLAVCEEATRECGESFVEGLAEINPANAEPQDYLCSCGPRVFRMASTAYARTSDLFLFRASEARRVRG